MKYVAWAGAMLGLLLAVPPAVEAQEDRATKPVRLLKNYPNPFKSETTIPFELDQGMFTSGHRPVVSMRIYNILAQLVAIPISTGSGVPFNELKLVWNGTGRYSAYWDGKILDTDRAASPGVYVYQLIVDDDQLTKRMTVVK